MTLTKLQRWNPFTIDDALSPRPPARYAVEGIFAIPSFNIVYGAPGSYKSFLMADLAICLASENDWLPPLPSDPGPLKPLGTEVVNGVAWFDFDNGTHRTHNRFEALIRHYQLRTKDRFWYFSMPFPTLDIGDGKHLADFSDILKDLGAEVVFIDNLATISGGRDENSSEIMQVMVNLRDVSERTQTAIIVIHHSRKENGYKGGQGDNLRGFSGIRGAIDTGLFVEREPYSSSVKVRSEKTRDVEVEPFSAYFSYTPKHGSKELEEACFWGVSMDEVLPHRMIESAIMSVLKSGFPGKQLNQTDLIKEVKKELKSANANVKGCGDAKIRTCIQDLVSKMAIQMTKGTVNNANLYFV